MSIPHDPRYAGDTLGLTLRRRFRRLPEAVQAALRLSGPLHHHKLAHVETALAHVGAPAVVAWLAGGRPLTGEGRTVA